MKNLPNNLQDLKLYINNNNLGVSIENMNQFREFMKTDTQ